MSVEQQKSGGRGIFLKTVVVATEAALIASCTRKDPDKLTQGLIESATALENLSNRLDATQNALKTEQEAKRSVPESSATQPIPTESPLPPDPTDTRKPDSTPTPDFRESDLGNERILKTALGGETKTLKNPLISEITVTLGPNGELDYTYANLKKLSDGTIVRMVGTDCLYRDLRDSNLLGDEISKGKYQTDIRLDSAEVEVVVPSVQGLPDKVGIITNLNEVKSEGFSEKCDIQTTEEDAKDIIEKITNVGWQEIAEKIAAEAGELGGGVIREFWDNFRDRFFGTETPQP